MQINKIPASQTVGYDATYTAKHDITTATVAFGYADGYVRYDERHIADERRVGFLDNVKVPLIGRVSMDLITFDISNAVKAGPVKTGDDMILVGENYDINDWARDCNTIGHEFLTLMGKRVKRAIEN